jgi:hypothetical protein
MTSIPYLFVAVRAEARLDGRDLRCRWPRLQRRLDARRDHDGLRRRHALCSGAKFILLSALLYTPGTILFIIAKREQSRTVFTPVEWLIFAVVVVAAIVGLYSLATGIISI